MPLGIGIGISPTLGAGVGGYTVVNSEAAALIARFTTPPTDARKRAIDTLVGDLKTATIWTKLDLFYVMSAADAQAAQRNWIADSFNLSPVNSPTFLADRGYIGDGSSSRLNTAWTPSLNAVKYAQDDASVWVWSLTAGQSDNVDIGDSAAASAQTRLTIRSTADVFNLRVNDASTFGPASTDGSGFFGAQRRGSTDKRAWRNGVQMGTNNAVSAGLPSDPQWVCGAYSGSFSLRRQAIAAWGASLSGLESAFYSAVLKYMQAVGAA